MRENFSLGSVFVVKITFIVESAISVYMVGMSKDIFLSHLTHQNTQKWCKGGVISIIGETVELNQWIHRFY